MTSGYVLMQPCRTAKATADAKGSSAEEVLTAGNMPFGDLDFPQIGLPVDFRSGTPPASKNQEKGLKSRVF